MYNDEDDDDYEDDYIDLDPDVNHLKLRKRTSTWSTVATTETQRVIRKSQFKNLTEDADLPKGDIITRAYNRPKSIVTKVEESESSSTSTSTASSIENAITYEESIKEELEEESTKSTEKLQESLTSSEILFQRALHPDDSFFDIEKPESLLDLRRLESFSSHTSLQSTDYIINPFILKWSFGYNAKTSLINLTADKKSKKIFFISGHKGVIYDCRAEKMNFIHGHANNVNTASVDRRGRWLVTSDFGIDRSIIITDIQAIGDTGSTVRTIYPNNEVGDIHLVSMSLDAKFIITISNIDLPQVNVYFWTLGKENADDFYQFNKSYGAPKKIAYNPNNPKHIMICFENNVAFTEINYESMALSEPTIPKRGKSSGTRTDCTYILNTHEALCTTSEGNLVVYGNEPFVQEFREHHLDNKKKYIKLIKVSKYKINCVVSTDKYVVTGDAAGKIQFFDTRLKLLYWIYKFEFPEITSICFNLNPRRYNFGNVLEMKEDAFLLPSVNEMLKSGGEDRIEEYETLYKNLVPSDVTLQGDPFISREFIVGTVNGNIYFVDCVHNTCEQLFHTSDSCVASIDCSDELPYLVIAYENGRVVLYNFETMTVIKNIILTQTFINTEEEIIPVVTTYIKYSPQSLHLVCGRSNGDIFFLNTILLEPIQELPIKHTDSKIIKICFSSNNKYCAYIDDKITVLILRYIKDIWKLCGKFRFHTKPIVDILFSPFEPIKLYTLGKDRFLVEYNLNDSTNEWVEVAFRSSVCHTSIPTSFIYNPSKPDEENPYILISDNEQKIRKIHLKTQVCRSVTSGPTYGCYGQLFVNNMKFLPNNYEKYVLFSNGKHIGIQTLPADGNPYKFISVCGNPNLKDFTASYDGNYVFSFGENDACILMWKVDVRSAYNLYRIGGKELEPFYCTIEGGVAGWFFKEMQDLYCYIQILHQGEICINTRTVSDRILISELPDLMRACGFYPTEAEINDMLIDITYIDYDINGKLREEVTFVDFVMLYSNHSPNYGITIKKLETCFKTICNQYGNVESVTRNDFLDMLSKFGDSFNTQSAQKCLIALTQFSNPVYNDGSGILLPAKIPFNVFLQEILGVMKDSSIEQIVELQHREENKSKLWKMNTSNIDTDHEIK